MNMEGNMEVESLQAYPEGVGVALPDSLPECMRDKEGFHSHFLVEVCANAVYDQKKRTSELRHLENYPDDSLTRGGHEYVQEVRDLFNNTIKDAFNVYTAASAFYIPKNGYWVSGSVTAQGIHLPPDGPSVPEWYADNPPPNAVILAFQLPTSYEDFPLLALDTTFPIRALYFPLLFKDCRYSNLSVLTQIDFQMKDQVTLENTDRGMPSMEIKLDVTRGLGFLPFCLVLDWWPLMCSLAIPHDRLPDGPHPCYKFVRLCSPQEAGQQFVDNFKELDLIAPKGSGCRYVWLDEYHSKNDGIQYTFVPPTKSETFDLVKSLVATGLGFIPFVGPLLAIAWDVAVMSLKEPEKFRSRADLSPEGVKLLRLQWQFLEKLLPSL